VVVGSTAESRTTEARVARLSHHHSAEGCPTGAGGYLGDVARDYVGVADRYRGTGCHIIGPDSDVAGS
ncbi:hypothetical protein KI387_035979, partial [Taxus chinensis]